LKYLTLTACFAAALTAIAAPAIAADATPAAGVPTQAALNAAARILVDTGLRSSLDAVVPDMLTGLAGRVEQTKPEAKDAIIKIVFALAPEFGKTEQAVLDAVANSLASQMSEKDLIATAAFYDSPAGKSYVNSTPVMLQTADAETRKWREKLGVDMLQRARDELRKQGFEF
jgi:uncharacterized protein